MKTIIAGGRDLISAKYYRDVCEAVEASGFQISEVVSGKQRGIDFQGEQWAKNNGLPIKPFPAKWTTYGPAAGPIRNGEMAAYADALVAVWDGHSRGTKDMIDQAERKGLKVYVHVVKGKDE